MDDSTQPIILKNLFGPDTNFDAFPWQPFRPGIRIHRIYGDGQSGPSAALLRYEAQATLAHHHHPGYEHIIVLANSQRDENGESRAGTLIVNRPGSGHSIQIDVGCVVLAIWEKPVVFSKSEGHHAAF